MPALSFYQNARLLAGLLLLALVFFFCACAKRSRSTEPANDQQSTANSIKQTVPRINLNTASANELETLPGIGKGLAARIIEHREKYGAFRRPEHLIIVRGISDKRFRALRDLITVD